MKIRTGFVSNSSSSSFIVAFDKLPESSAEVKELLFGDAKEWCMDGLAHDVYTFPTEVIADVVWGNIQAQKHKLPYSRDYIAGEMDNRAYLYHYTEDGTDNEREDWYEMEEGPEREAALEKENQELNALRDKLADEFLQENEGKVIMLFTYADDDGSLGLVMEHAEIFRNLSYCQINNH